MSETQKPISETPQEPDKINLEKLRERHRKELSAYRENQRKFLLQKARFLQENENIQNPPDYDVITLAKSLKNKGQITCQLLNTVMNTLLESEENISEFLKVDGALQALLRLLSGHNEKFQLISAQCICNLALGNEKQSLQVLKASESYLMMHLSGRNHYVMEACIIALGNLSRQSLKNIELLISQGFFLKIINFLKSDDSSLEAAAVYALTQLVYHGVDILRPEDVEASFLAVVPIFKKRSFSVAFLMSILSSCPHIHIHFISNGIHIDALQYLLISVKENEKEALYFLRILSNLISDHTGEVGKKLIEDQNYITRDCISCLLKSEKDYLGKECLGFIGNLINHPVEILRIYGGELVKENYELIKSLFYKYKSMEKIE